jgi:pyroglutamyl-peptidase
LVGFKGMSGRTVLVTAFEPFGGETINASWAAARALDGWRCGDTVAVARRLPCVYDACVAEFVEAFERLRPEAVLMTGQAARRAVVSVESVARNGAGASAADNGGVVRSEIASEGPALLEATVRPVDVAREIRAAGLPARVSTNAGDYVCNHLFYEALRYLRRQAPGTPAVFVHLPATPEQTPRRASRSRLATADAVRALEAAISAMAKQGAHLERGADREAREPGFSVKKIEVPRWP